MKANFLHFPEGKCIHELFEWMCNQQPNAIALVVGEKNYTYRDLDQKANQLAHFLLTQNIKREDLIAISVERSAEMIIGILGILKAGSAYLPIDPKTPKDRVAFMLNQSQAPLLISQAHLLSNFDHFHKTKLVLDADLESIKNFPTTAVELPADPRQLAYTIFTSGSTGKPKGVQIEHHSVVNLVQGQLAFVQHPVDRFLYAYSFAFDGSVLLIFWTLLSGGTLVMAPEGLEKDVTQIANFIQKHKISHLLTFASLYGLLLERFTKVELKSLQSVSVAGEACPTALVKQHHQVLPGCTLLNQYGPTEATVGATIYKTSPKTAELQRVPIGKAINGVAVYVLDKYLNKAAIGEIGELYIAGKGIARAYLNRPDLTKKRFVNNPFSTAPYYRLYKTGDLAIQLEDGNFDFIGRADFQVKLRGYRIELGEIETQLCKHPEIREATVLLKGEAAAEQKLVAYLVYKENKTLNNAILRKHLAIHLPEYMIPSVFMAMEKMPVTNAGKVDRGALPEPGSHRPVLAQAYVVARTPVEKMLENEWKKVLNLEEIGIHDKFFELGGNSLQAADFIGRIQNILGEVIFITSIFDHSTIAAYAKMLEKDYTEAVDKYFNNNIKSKESTKKKEKLKLNDFTDFDKFVPESALLKAKINTSNQRNKDQGNGLDYGVGEPTDFSKIKKNKQAVFILAPPRSGTSLLRIMLAGHPQLLASNELQLLHFDTLEERNTAYQGKFSLWSEGLVRLIMELENCSPDQAKGIVQQYKNEGFTTKEVYAKLQEKIGNQLLVDKSPSYALDLMALEKAEADFDQPIFIHLLRHPYAMVRSFAKMHMDQVMYLKPHHYDAKQLGELIWTRSHQIVNGFLESIPADRKFQLKYEDLVQQPEATMKQLCKTLNWEYNPALINPYKDLNSKMVDGLYDKSKPMGDIKLLKHGKIDPKLADVWKGVKEDNFLSKSTWEIAESFAYKGNEKKTEPKLKNQSPEKNANNLASFTSQVNQRPKAKDKRQKNRDIAIIGMSGRFPGADNLEEFWENLKNGTDVSKTFTAEDLEREGLDPNLLKNPDYVNRGMPLKNASHFAAEFFGYLPKEAALMDPQHRVFLECAYTALENAAYHSGNKDQRIGIYGAIARNTYLVNNVMAHPRYFESIDDFQLGITLEKDFPATRVAYKLDLKGPAANIQTACSSSGAALHMACQSILLDESDILLVGGGRIQAPLHGGHLHKEGHALSPDGYVRAFDADANGMVRGHGMAFIVIKKLEKAIADGDTIHAVIKGSAIGNDGANKIGFTAPAIEGQSRTIVQAYKNAGVDPASVSYIEAHGTGTRLGDPIEMAALTKAFSNFTDKKQYCAIGTVKTNIGHLDAGACIAGIIKTVLALKKEVLPPSLHFNKANPQIPFDKSPFYVNGRRSEWKRTESPRRAGVSSFGLGGTNAHIVLEEAPLIEISTGKEESQLLILSAKTASALDSATVALGGFLQKNPNHSLTKVAATLQLGRKAYAHKRMLVAENIKDAATALQQNNPQRIRNSEGQSSNEKIVFMFPGGGAQHTNMGLGLYQTERVFKETVDECLTILADSHQLDLRTVLYPSHSKSEPITNALHGVTLLFTIEYATAKLWISKGVLPTEMIGHSLGEYVAACLAEVFSLEDALALVAKRGKLFLQLAEGGMLSIPLAEKELMPYMDENLSLAAINKPDYCVVSGPSIAIDRIKEKLTADEIHAPRLHINVAAHSIMVEAILDEFGRFLEEVEFHGPKIPIVSNLNGKYALNGTMQAPDYWKKHLRQTVRFADGMATLLEEDHKVFLEVGPGQTLSTFARQHPRRNNKHTVIASLRHPKETINDRSFFLKSMGQLWLVNIDIDWKQNFDKVNRIPLPTYPFEREHYWIDAKRTTAPADDTMVSYSTTKMEHKEEDKQKHTQQYSRKNWLQRELKNVFHQLSGLPTDRMQDHATFLELGFDSLFLTQSITKIKKKLGVKINFRQLFDEAPTIDALAQFLDGQLPASAFKEELRALNVGQNTVVVTKKVDNSLPVRSIPVANENGTMPTPRITQNTTNGNVENLIQQQLLLMQQQLDLLKGNVVSTINLEQNAPVSYPSANHTPVPPIPVKPEQEQSNNVKSGAPKDFTSFGPWIPIEKKNRGDLTEREKKYLDDLIQRYTNKTKGSQQLSERQRKHMADPRSIVGFNRMWKDMIYQIAMDRSKGARMWDIDGNEYVDFRSSFGVNLFGHSPDFLQEAIIDQVNKGFELGVLTPLAEKVCDLICELTGTERVSLVNTGSEAVSAAVRAARTATGKDKIIVFEGDYHGIADELLVKGINRGGKKISLPAAPGIPMNLVDQVIVLKYDDPDLLAIIKENADDLAAVIIEPIQPNNPTNQPVELFKAIRKLTAEEDIAMVFDELITGFRIAQGGAQAWYGIEVDIVAYGKVLCGGLPMAAVAGKSRFLDVFDGGQWQYGDDSIPEAGVTFFGGTFCKHPVSLAASLAALQEIKRQGQGMYDELNAKSARFAERLIELFERTKVPIQVLSTASIVAIKLTDKNPLSSLFFYYLRLKGLFIEDKAALITMGHTEEDLNFAYKMFEEAIKEMQTAGFFQITVAPIDTKNNIISTPLLGRQEGMPNLKNEKKKVPLTEGQKEVWVEHQFGNAAAAAYNLSGIFHFHGRLKVDHLQTALQQLVDRHEALRTIYDYEDLFQYILPSLKIETPFLDLSDLGNKEKEAELERLQKKETTEVLDLFKGPLFRVKIIQTEESAFQLLMTVHHGIADGWSCGLLAKELSILYTATCQGQKPKLSDPQQLSNYALDEQAFQQSEEAKETADYWLSQFEGEVPVLDFPTDFPRPIHKTYDASLESISLSAKLIEDLKRYSTNNRATLFVTLYTAFQTLIHRLSGQEDFVLGVVAAGQSIAGNEHLIAHGVNLLPIRTSIDPREKFTTHLQKMRNKILDGFEYQQYTLGSLVKALKLPRDPGRQPVISILFNMDAGAEALHFDDMEVAVRPIPRSFETFDSFINVKPLADGSVAFEWIYNTDLFLPGTIELRLEEFKTLLQSILSQEDAEVKDLAILPKRELALLEKWNETKGEYPRTKLLHQLFEEQVKIGPQRVAVRSEREQWNYQKLNEKANQLAHFLKGKGLEKGDFVGVFLHRDVQLLLGLLAVIKAGGIYVPLDPSNPRDRLRVIVDDAACSYLLTEEKLMNRLPTKGAQIICLERCQKEINAAPKNNLNLMISPEDLVYVNYTSGSSGKPKGVLISHYAVLDHHYAIKKALDFNADDVICSVASVAFDPSVQDYFMPLFFGASVAIVSEETKTDGFMLKAYLEELEPTLMQATPSTWRMLLLAGWNGNSKLCLLSGGEGLTKDLSNKLLSKCKSLYNIYGPTETTIWSTLKKVDAEVVALKTISGYEPVGRPIQNVQIYILDPFMNLVAIGAPGELYIGGVGVAPNGYFKRDSLSKEKFIDNPFSTEIEARLYRTGDIGRYLPNGDIEYLNRLDNQVKIRGFRIELGEIETSIAAYEGVRESVVVIREDQAGHKRLVAYIVMEEDVVLKKQALKDWLADKLPAYMIPLDFVEMEEFPLTATSKINRNKLPIPTHVSIKKDTGIVAPSTPEEVFLINLWQKLIGVSNIGIYDNFFELGGHSLIAVSMITAIEKEIGKKLPLSALLEYSTVSRLAKLLQRPSGSEKDSKQMIYRSLVPIKKEGSKPPIYLVHGAGLHVLMFQTFAAHMDKDQPIYGLQARGLDGEVEPLGTIEEIAACYIKEILDQNPNGPYLLGGYSFGGLIAFEIARQLQAKGKEIAMLGMFDTVVRFHLSDHGQTKNYYEQLMELGKKVSFNISILAKNPIKNLKYKSHILKRRYRRWQWGWQAKKQVEVRDDKLDYIALVDRMNQKAFENYKIEPYQGEIHLFRAKEKRFYLDDFEYLGWKPFALKGIKIKEVPGDHLHLFNPPNGAEFARILQKAIEESMARRQND